MASRGEMGTGLNPFDQGRRSRWTSLDDIDESTSTPFRIASPRSLTALRNCSLRPEQLHYKPLNVFQDGDVPLKVAQTNYEISEKRRLLKLELVKTEYRAVCR